MRTLARAVPGQTVRSGSPVLRTGSLRETLENSLAQVGLPTVIIATRPPTGLPLGPPRATGIPRLKGGAKSIAQLGFSQIVAGARSADGRRPDSAGVSGLTISQAGLSQTVRGGPALGCGVSCLKGSAESVAHLGCLIRTAGATTRGGTDSARAAGACVTQAGLLRVTRGGPSSAWSVTRLRGPRLKGGAELVAHLGCPVRTAGANRGGTDSAGTPGRIVRHLGRRRKLGPKGLRGTAARFRFRARSDGPRRLKAHGLWRIGTPRGGLNRRTGPARRLRRTAGTWAPARAPR